MRISPILAGLMLPLLGISTSLAEVTYTTEAGGYILNSGSVTDDMVLTGSGSPTSVGSYHGPSTIVIEEGASLTTPNALFIGGKGYDTTGTSGGDGTIIVSKDATLTVGAENSNDGDGAHLDIGNSQYSCIGTLNINGGTVNAKAASSWVASTPVTACLKSPTAAHSPWIKQATPSPMNSNLSTVKLTSTTAN